MVGDEIQSDIDSIARDASLYEETNFDSRSEAIDTIEFTIIDRIEGLLQANHPPAQLILLKQDAERVKHQLEAIDDGLFQRLRTDIRNGGCTGTTLKGLIDRYVGRDASGTQEHAAVGYDTLDLFVNRLLLIQAIPAETQALEHEMVYYQKTPARIMFELVEKAHLTEEDVFYDLGSGLGHIPILVNLLSGAITRGVECEPAYCEYARACTADLNLSRVTFIHADARTADYSGGTVFFMYTPFVGSVLQDVLEKLRQEAQKRTIRLFTYGPCTPKVFQQRWLICGDQHGERVDTLAVFTSIVRHPEVL